MEHMHDDTSPYFRTHLTQSTNKQSDRIVASSCSARNRFRVLTQLFGQICEQQYKHTVCCCFATVLCRKVLKNNETM